MSRVLVTGANGFVGRPLCAELLKHGDAVTGLVRDAGGCVGGTNEWRHARADFADLAAAWPTGLEIDCVVHLAARVHVMNETFADPLAAFRATNVDGTLRVAETAYANGVQRLVFVSSIKALAERDNGCPLCEGDPPRPEGAYGRSKLEAERELVRFGAETGLEIVIVRPPLVYGPGVKANFLRLTNAIAKGVPLPLGAVSARRSLLYVGNFVHALRCCATDPRAANNCFHVADGEDLTVSELARELGRHLNRRARLVPVPDAWLHAAGRLMNRLPQVERLIGNLRVDTTHVRSVLDWQPPYSTDEALAETARWYRAAH